MENWQILLAPLGILIIIGTIVLAAKWMKQQIQWTRTQATITSVKEKKRKPQRDAPSIVYTYRYTDLRGKTHSGNGTRVLKKPKKGSSIAVIYDPEIPERSEIPSVTDGVLGVLVLAAVGVFFIAAGLDLINLSSNGPPPSVYN